MIDVQAPKKKNNWLDTLNEHSIVPLAGGVAEHFANVPATGFSGVDRVVDNIARMNGGKGRGAMIPINRALNASSLHGLGGLLGHKILGDPESVAGYAGAGALGSGILGGATHVAANKALSKGLRVPGQKFHFNPAKSFLHGGVRNALAGGLYGAAAGGIHKLRERNAGGR